MPLKILAALIVVARGRGRWRAPRLAAKVGADSLQFGGAHDEREHLAFPAALATFEDEAPMARGP